MPNPFPKELIVRDRVFRGKNGELRRVLGVFETPVEYEPVESGVGRLHDYVFFEKEDGRPSWVSVKNFQHWGEACVDKLHMAERKDLVQLHTWLAYDERKDYAWCLSSPKGNRSKGEFICAFHYRGPDKQFKDGLTVGDKCHFRQKFEQVAKKFPRVYWIDWDRVNEEFVSYVKRYREEVGEEGWRAKRPHKYEVVPARLQRNRRKRKS